MFPDHVGDPLRHLLYAAGVLAMVIALGTFGYMIIEGWSVFDGLYMTVTTITTVGYREVNPLSAAGRAFTIGLILAGVGTLFYVLGNFARFVLEGEFAAGIWAISIRRKSESDCQSLYRVWVRSDGPAYL